MADSLNTNPTKYQLRKALGMCCACGKAKARAGITECDVCVNKKHLRRITLISKRTNTNSCYRCGVTTEDGVRASNGTIRCRKCVDIGNIRGKDRVLLLRTRVFNAYGNKCTCCGETSAQLITIDHIENNGADHRREVGHGGDFYRWIIQNNYPKSLRLQCYNCNCGRHRNGGVCPHEESRPYYTQGVAIDQPPTLPFFLE